MQHWKDLHPNNISTTSKKMYFLVLGTFFGNKLLSAVFSMIFFDEMDYSKMSNNLLKKYLQCRQEQKHSK